MYRQALVRQTRLFSTSVYLRKGPIEGVKDTAKTVDRTVSDTIVKGIEKGGTYLTPYDGSFAPMLTSCTEEAAGKAKEAAGIGKDKAKEAADDAAQKAKEGKDEAAKKI